MTTLNVSKIRSDTPGCEERIHFNNAGASLMPQPVLRAQVDHLELEARIGGYEAAAAQATEIGAVYHSAASLVNAKPAEIALVENATVAWQLAFASIPFQPGDRIITAQAAYASNYLNFLLAKERFGIEIDVIPADEEGQLDIDALANMMDDRVRLVAITHVPTNGGLVNPAAEVGQITKDSEAFYLLDACQSVGQLPIDVQAIGCDFLSATGRKWLRGPRGTGFLYASETVLDKVQLPFIDLHAASWVEQDRYELRKDARRFENWEFNYAALLGLGAALDYAQQWGMDAIWQQVEYLGNHFRNCLRQTAKVTVQDIGAVQGGLVTFSHSDLDATAIKNAMAEHQINVSTSTPFSTRLDAEARNLPNLVRASVHYFNTESEIERFCAVLSTTTKL